MTKNGAKRLIVASSMVTLGSVSMGHMMPEDKGGKGELPPARMLIGSGILYTTLSLIVDPAPGLAGAIAIMLMTVALAEYGIPLMDRYFNPPGQKLAPYQHFNPEGN